LTVRKSATDFPKEPSPTSSSIRFLEVNIKTEKTLRKNKKVGAAQTRCGVAHRVLS
jgi:hypothetical protein